MKYLKMLGLAAIAAGALMALAGAGTASATELTCKNAEGKIVMCPAPTAIHAVNEGIVTLDAALTIECKKSTVSGNASTGGGSSTETPNGAITALTFEECEGWHVTVVAGHLGTLEVHTKTAVADGNGTVTSAGTEVTLEGFGLHCIYGTSTGHDIGTLTGSKNLENKTATFDIEAEVTRVGGRSGAFCGGTTAKWTGFYSITTPDYLDVD